MMGERSDKHTVCVSGNGFLMLHSTHKMHEVHTVIHRKYMYMYMTIADPDGEDGCV